jgi:cell wall-associated NlpC family hydrolase
VTRSGTGPSVGPSVGPVVGSLSGAAGLVVLVVLLTVGAGATGPADRTPIRPRSGPVPVADDPFVPPDGGAGFGDRMLRAAAAQLGVPYSWGGGSLTGPSRGIAWGAGTVGFDCSALVRFAAYQASGGTLRVPRTADAQTRVGTPVPLDRLRPGDVISFTRPDESVAHHVGIYAGLGRMVHAPLTTGHVRVESLRNGYWRTQQWRAVRYVP